MIKPNFPSPEHDHKHCMDVMMQRAETICRDKNLRLTDLRRLVLEVIAANHKALGAYEIIDQLKQRGRKIAPISIYRILEFLLGAGLIHRLESENAFFACHGQQQAEEDHMSPIIFICRHCGLIGETASPGLDKSLQNLARKMAFLPDHYQIEIKGCCDNCALRDQ